MNESANSISRSGVSAANLVVENANAAQRLGGLNRNVVAGKGTTEALSKAWTGAQALDNVGAQMQISSAAMPRLAKEIGDYAATKEGELRRQGKPDEAAKWAEGGIYRVAAHSVLGAMGGGLGGALSTTAVTASTSTIADQISTLAVTDEVKDAATLAVGAAVGLVIGGQVGAATAANELANNYLSHVRMGFNKPSEQAQFEKAVAECNSGDTSACKKRDDFIGISQMRDLHVAAVCSNGPSAECHDVVAVAQQAGNKVLFGTKGNVTIYPAGSSELVAGNVNGGESFHQEVSRSTGQGLVVAGLAMSPAMGSATIAVGGDILAGYKAASAAYSLSAAAASGAGIAGVSYAASTATSVLLQNKINSTQEFKIIFEDNFSYPGLGAAMTVGALSGMYGASMFNWAGVPNEIKNVVTLPGFMIRLNNWAMSQAAGRAAQAGVKESKHK